MVFGADVLGAFQSSTIYLMRDNGLLDVAVAFVYNVYKLEKYILEMKICILLSYA